MKKLYVADEFIRTSGKVCIQCIDLVGTGRNWNEPAKILGISTTDFILKMKNEFNAEIYPYRKNGKVSFVGFSWSSLAEARKWKNFINKVAREKKYMI